MFAPKQMLRFFSSSSSFWGPSKSNLAELRKKTGYTFSNCKKALDMHNNDLEKAEKWLHEQAQAMGWAKASNLGGRKASDGLIAVAVNKNIGAMVELNCETDFVARNSSFQSLIWMAAQSCLNMVPQICSQNTSINKVVLDSQKLGMLPGPDGKTLADHVALQIGLLGENMILKRAVLLLTNEKLLLSGFSHPAPLSQTEPMVGKYGAIVAFNTKDRQPLTEINENIGKGLCQHVIGMNPKLVGDPSKDKPQENADDEAIMIYQDYILDPESKVHEILDEQNIEVFDFVRFECGESAESEKTTTARAQA